MNPSTNDFGYPVTDVGDIGSKARVAVERPRLIGLLQDWRKVQDAEGLVNRLRGIPNRSPAVERNIEMAIKELQAVKHEYAPVLSEVSRACPRRNGNILDPNDQDQHLHVYSLFSVQRGFDDPDEQGYALELAGWDKDFAAQWPEVSNRIRAHQGPEVKSLLRVDELRAITPAKRPLTDGVTELSYHRDPSSGMVARLLFSQGSQKVMARDSQITRVVQLPKIFGKDWANVIQVNPQTKQPEIFGRDPLTGKTIGATFPFSAQIPGSKVELQALYEENPEEAIPLPYTKKNIFDTTLPFKEAYLTPEATAHRIKRDIQHHSTTGLPKPSPTVLVTEAEAGVLPAIHICCGVGSTVTYHKDDPLYSAGRPRTVPAMRALIRQFAPGFEFDVGTTPNDRLGGMGGASGVYLEDIAIGEYTLRKAIPFAGSNFATGFYRKQAKEFIIKCEEIRRQVEAFDQLNYNEHFDVEPSTVEQNVARAEGEGSALLEQARSVSRTR